MGRRTPRMVRLRYCLSCPPGEGCNDGPEFPMVKHEEYLSNLYIRGGVIPAKTHILILNVNYCDLITNTNPNTEENFQDGEVIELFSNHSKIHPGKVRGEEYSPLLYGEIGRAWIPTIQPVTVYTEEELKLRKDWDAAIREDEEWNYNQQLKREQKERERRARGKKLYENPAETMPVADYLKNESYMRSQVGAWFLEQAGACAPPRNYVADFPDDFPVANIWHDYIMQNKPNPVGQPVQFYWVNRILGYAPGLLKEALKRTREKLKREDDGYEEITGHLRDARYRKAFSEVMPWAEIEFRLRQTEEIDLSKERYYGYGTKVIYKVTQHEEKLGVVQYPPVKEEAAEQEERHHEEAHQIREEEVLAA